MLIPISGKPGDLDTSNIKSASDADRVLMWLAAVLKDMNTQVEERGGSDQDWLRKIRAAQRATTNLRHRVLELRDGFFDKMTIHEALVTAMVSVLEPEDLAQVSIWIEKNSPHLSGIDFTCLATDRQG
jgi:hypothetical protein